jgi:hypothetical protein
LLHHASEQNKFTVIDRNLIGNLVFDELQISITPPQTAIADCEKKNKKLVTVTSKNLNIFMVVTPVYLVN